MATKLLRQLLLGLQLMRLQNVLACQQPSHQRCCRVCNTQRSQNAPSPPTHMSGRGGEKHHEANNKSEESAATITHKNLGRWPVQNRKAEYCTENEQANPRPRQIAHIPEI